MKKIKRIIHSTESEQEIVPWLDPLICLDLPGELNLPPYPQTNTFTTKLVGYTEVGSNNSQQFRFMFFNQNGTSKPSNWSLLANNNIRTDNLDTNIELYDMYEDYLENDIQVQFQNTQGPVYMNVYNFTDSSSGPSLALQSYCASFLTGPLDSAAAMRQAPYNGNRPAGYAAWQGMSTQMSTVTAIQDSTIDFKITFYSISFSTYPAATWVYQIYRTNSQTVQSLVTSGTLVLNQNTPILNVYLYKFVCNYQYVLKLVCYNGGTQVASPFADIPLTTYMGLSMQASRISGQRGNAPIQTTVPSGLASVSWSINAIYRSPYLQTPVNDSDLNTYIQLKIVTTLQNQLRPSIIKGLTIWYNFDGVSGYWPLCINVPVSNGTQFQLRTGGEQQTSVAFSIPYLRNLVSWEKPLHFAISTFSLNEGAYCNEEFTGGRFTTSLAGLVDLAQASPNQWVTNSTYQINVQTVRNGISPNTSVLSFQIQAQYTQNVSPTIIPPQGEEAIKLKAVDDAEQVVEKLSRVDWNAVTDPHTQFMLEHSYMNDQLPTFKQRAAKYTYNNPTQMEHMELAKEQIHQFIKKEGGDTWLDAPVSEFFGLLQGLDSAAARVKYPQLFKRDANKAFIAQNLLKEHYPHATSVLDFYQPLQSLPRAPFYKGMNQNEKLVNQQILDSMYHKGIMGTGMGSDIRKIQHDIETDIRASKDPGLVASFGGYNPSELNLLYYNLGLKYNPQNETQGQMLESLMNPGNADLYVPENKLFGDVPTYTLLAQNWLDSQLNLETFAIVMANYIATKRSFNAESVKGLDKGTMSEMFSGLIKDTLYNFNPLGVEAKFVTTAMLKTVGQKAIYNTIKDYVKTYGSFDNLVSLFSKMKKPLAYDDKRSRDVERPKFWLGLPSVNEYYLTDSQRLEREKRKTSKYPLESRTYLYDHLGTGNTKIDPKEIEIVRKFEMDNPNWTYSQLQDLKKKLYVRKFGKLTRGYKSYFPSVQVMDELTLENLNKAAKLTKDAIQASYNFIQPHAKNAMEIYLPYLNKKGGEFIQYLREEGEKIDRKKHLPWYKFGFGTPDYRWADKIRMQVAEDASRGIVRVPDSIKWGVPDFFKHFRIRPLPLMNLPATQPGYEERTEKKRLQQRNEWSNAARERAIMEANFPIQQRYWDAMTIRSENERVLKELKEQRLKRAAQEEIDRLSYPQAVNEPWRFRLSSLPQIPSLPSDGQMGQYFMDVDLQNTKDQKDFEQYVRDRGRRAVRLPDRTPIGDFLKNPLMFTTPKKREAKKQAKAQAQAQATPQEQTSPWSWSDVGKTTLKIGGGLGALYLGIKGAQKTYDYIYPSPPDVNLTMNSTQNSSLQSNNTFEVPSQPFSVIDDEIPMEETVQQDESVQQNVNPSATTLNPEEFFADDKNDVRAQQMREDIAANQITAEVIIATAESQIDLEALLDDDKSDNSSERLQNIHAVGKLLTALDRKVKSSVQLQHFLKIGLGNMFERQYKRQYIRGNQEGFMHFKMLKAIINPKTPDEFQLQKIFYNYFLSKPLYDAQDVLSKKYGEPLLDGLKELMLSPGPVFDFIERIAHKSGVHKTSFNGSMYAESSRPVYSIPERMSVRPIYNDISIMPIKRLKNIKF